MYQVKEILWIELSTLAYRDLVADNGLNVRTKDDVVHVA